MSNKGSSVTLLTSFALVAVHRSCSPINRGRERQIEKSQCLQLKFSVQHLRSTTKDNPNTPLYRRRQPYWEVENGTLWYTTILTSDILN